MLTGRFLGAALQRLPKLAVERLCHDHDPLARRIWPIATTDREEQQHVNHHDAWNPGFVSHLSSPHFLTNRRRVLARWRSTSIQTAATMTTPITTFCQLGDTFSKVNPLRSTPMMSAPMRDRKSTRLNSSH